MIKLSFKKTIWLLAVIGLLIFLHYTRILSPIESLVVKILNPIMGTSYSISTNLRNTYNKQISKKDLNLEIAQLREQVNKLTTENIKLKMLEEENKILREHLQFLSKNKYQYKMSKIISQSSFGDSSVHNSVIIDKGEKDNLYPGLPVVSSKGIIVGKIIKVKNDISEVYLINNPKNKLAVTVQNQDNTSGIVQGELGLTAKMEFIPQTEKINTGDIIITSGLEQSIPRGLIIGKVSQVFKESNELWQSAVVEPMVNLDELIIVSVLLP